MLNSKLSFKFSVCIVVLAVFTLCVTGCTSPSITSLPAVIKNFNCDISVTSGEREYACTLNRENNVSMLTVKEPEELDGLILEYTQGVYSVSFKGLKMSLDDSKTQLTRYFADGLMKVMDKTFSLEDISATEDNGVWLYEGETAYGGFEVKFDREGKLLEVDIPSIDTKIAFENFKEIE